MKTDYAKCRRIMEENNLVHVANVVEAVCDVITINDDDELFNDICNYTASLYAYINENVNMTMVARCVVDFYFEDECWGFFEDDCWSPTKPSRERLSREDLHEVNRLDDLQEAYYDYFAQENWL